MQAARIAQPPAWLLAAALAGLYLLLDPPSADLAAQTYRTWLFHHAGFTIWDNGWYAGHHVPAYSVLFPPLSALLGPRVVGALAAVGAAWAFERLAATTRPAGARPAALLFAVATAAPLVSGRLTFALGVATAVAAALALARGRLGLAALAGTATALASPVAAVFLALALVARGAGHRDRRGLLTTLALLVATLAPAGVLSLLFPEGGDFPFAASALWPSLGATLLVGVLLPRGERALRLGVGLYALLLVAAAALSTPMGGNAVRLGAVMAAPVAALVLWPARRGVLLALAPLLLYWQWTTPVNDWVHAARDPSVRAPYYAGLLARLAAAGGPPFRLEIPFTDNHWESARVGTHVPLARGWERQMDRKVNRLFYDGRPLTAARYRRWLDENAVRFVALPDAPLDPSAAAEAALVRRGIPYLDEVWHDAHWRLFAVRDPAPLARGARATALGIDSVTLDAPRAGRVALRVRWTPYWRLVAGRGCVVADGDWTALQLTRPGPARIRADFAPGRARARTPRCTPR
ncbi:hypothetical protein [Baekduia soli]|uniref:hypothetical protein n=1 Tax=Baekduia soli TaxID=496014 RepID=UPI001651D8AA|nr:hypothetical protein [Baekduia soli]